jgi:hypothetical protein
MAVVLMKLFIEEVMRVKGCSSIPNEPNEPLCGSMRLRLQLIDNQLL